ncbi:MAG: DUF393 domain-containing protein [Bacteroidetes bacterium]|nr:DUF393 domain-containing protein [Bacteroidota bacterium]
MKGFSKLDDKNIIIFDGYCNFCSWGVQFLLKKDKQKTFVFSASQSESGIKLLTHYNIQVVDSVLYIRKGVVLNSSSAVLHILRDLGYPWKIFFVFIVIPEFIRNAIYKAFAKSRYSLFGRRATCRMPSENELKRFL